MTDLHDSAAACTHAVQAFEQLREALADWYRETIDKDATDSDIDAALIGAGLVALAAREGSAAAVETLRQSADDLEGYAAAVDRWGGDRPATKGEV